MPSLLPGGFKPFFWNVQLCPDNISISCECREAEDLRVGKMHFSLGFSDRRETQILMCALLGHFSWWKKTLLRVWGRGALETRAAFVCLLEHRWRRWGSQGQDEPLLRPGGRAACGTDMDQRKSPAVSGAARPTASHRIPASSWLPCHVGPTSRPLGPPAACTRIAWVLVKIARSWVQP